MNLSEVHCVRFAGIIQKWIFAAEFSALLVVDFSGAKSELTFWWNKIVPHIYKVTNSTTYKRKREYP